MSSSNLARTSCWKWRSSARQPERYVSSALPFLPTPAVASWPFLAASVVLECIYYTLLAAAYRSGEMSAVYPVMRGTAPVLVAIFGTIALGEHLSPYGWAAVLAICAGVFSMVFSSGSRMSGHRSAIWLALANAVVIAAYTLVDGIGARRSGSPTAYAFWVFFLAGIPILAWALVSRRQEICHLCAQARRHGAFRRRRDGDLIVLALLAMTQAPIALVAALRETRSCSRRLCRR